MLRRAHSVLAMPVPVAARRPSYLSQTQEARATDAARGCNTQPAASSVVKQQQKGDRAARELVQAACGCGRCDLAQTSAVYRATRSQRHVIGACLQSLESSAVYPALEHTWNGFALAGRWSRLQAARPVDLTNCRAVPRCASFLCCASGVSACSADALRLLSPAPSAWKTHTPTQHLHAMAGHNTSPSIKVRPAQRSACSAACRAGVQRCGSARVDCFCTRRPAPRRRATSGACSPR